MKAAVIEEFGPPDVVAIGDADEPLVGPDFVLVEMAAAGVNPVDWKVVAGGLQSRFPHHFPLIPGWDVAGEVVATGPAVTSVGVGDTVAAYARKDHVQHGTFAERVAVPERAVAPVPTGVDVVRAGALPLAGLTALQLIDRVGVREGDTVLVHAAAGGVGSIATQLAAMRGARVIGTASPANHDYLRGLGAVPVDYGHDLAEQVRGAAADGVDVVLDLVGGDALARTPQLLRGGGRLGSIIDPATTAELGGAYVFVRPDAAGLAGLLDLVAAGSLTVQVSAEYDLSRAGEALARCKDGHGRGKIVITR